MPKSTRKTDQNFKKCKSSAGIIIKNDGIGMEKNNFDTVPAPSGAQTVHRNNPECLRIPLTCGMSAFMTVHSGFFTKKGEIV